MTYCGEITVPRVCLERGLGFARMVPMNVWGLGAWRLLVFHLFQSIRLGAGSSELALSCMAALLDYRGGPACLERRKAEILSAFGQERTKVDFGRGRFVRF